MQTPALGVEHARDGQRRAHIVERRAQFDGATEHFEQRFGEEASLRGLARFDETKRGTCLAHFGEGMQQFHTRSLVMRDETRGVATTNTTRGDNKVVTPASGDAAQFQLARQRLRLRVGCICRPCGERKPRVTLHAFARVEHCAAHPCGLRGGRFKQQVFDAM